MNNKKLQIFLYFTKTIKRPSRPGADPVPPLAEIIEILPNEDALVVLLVTDALPVWLS